MRESSSHSKYNIQAHSTARRKRSHEIRYILMSLSKGSSSLMLSHNPLRQISIKRVRVSDKTVSMYEQERVNGCYLRLVKSLLFSFFLPKMCFGLHSRFVYLYFVRWMASWEIYMLCTWAMSCIHTIKLKRNPSYPWYEMDCEYDLTWEFWSCLMSCSMLSQTHLSAQPWTQLWALFKPCIPLWLICLDLRKVLVTET